ncbi:carbonate dehydratase NCE103 [Ascoidea rubescens DSM 1968]|uniref:Carbonic anhydrase n=1 Tax=Ascoidea rubescens DSM 1968 TaxID=1344418 RepID=A0A1D2VF68_9ASCO|nr:carbonic anhydrase [Ascoidea rubescens DSM 1968]ODV60117.1 carbonic anhydrase [Ascoidea rubescens DSM 1968]
MSANENENGNENEKKNENNNATLQYGLNENSSINDYLRLNRKWSISKREVTNDLLFKTTAKGQSPHTLWIGCSDSRYNEDCFEGVLPGEIFTFRNIANILNHPEDISTNSMLSFAINKLKIKKILIVGHTDCGGVWASLMTHKHANNNLSVHLNKWLKPLIELKFENEKKLDEIKDPNDRCAKLVELNIKSQLKYLIHENHDSKLAYNERRIEIHGLIFDVSTGLLSPVYL